MTQHVKVSESIHLRDGSAERQCTASDLEGLAAREAATPSVLEPRPRLGKELVTPYLIEDLVDAGAPDEVIKLIMQRDAYGRQKYGQGLMTHDGRDSLEDLMQELGDAIQYAYKFSLEGATDCAKLQMALKIARFLAYFIEEVKMRARKPCPAQQEG